MGFTFLPVFAPHNDRLNHFDPQRNRLWGKAGEQDERTFCLSR